MKRHLITTLLAGMLLATAVGCSGKSNDTPADTGNTTESTVAAAEDIPADAQELEGTIDEVKDSMFVIEATDGTYYAFNFGDNVPVAKGDLTAGEKVKIYYSGELSEVDPFTGIIYKIEKE